MVDIGDLRKVAEILKGEACTTWIFSGDSITQGVRHTHGWRDYSEIFAEHIHWGMKRFKDIVVNTGVDGSTTDDVLCDFGWLISRFDPSVVFLMFAMNDCQADQVSPDAFRENLRTLVHRIRSINAVPVLQAPNPVKRVSVTPPHYKSREHLARYVSIISDVAASCKVIFIDHWSAWQGSFGVMNGDQCKYEKLLDDELHPNGEGHRAMARLIFKELSFDTTFLSC